MYCEKCVADNIETALSCIKCGSPLFGASKQKTTPSSTALWSPDKAAFFSIFFTPTFGAIIHALNWHQLGQKSKAIQSWLWAAATFITYIVVSVYGGLHQYSNDDVIKLLVLNQWITIIVWYFLSARAQSKYVVNQFKDGYTRNSWFNPFCISIIVWGGLSWLGS
jgi:hypothetical protein